MKRFIKAVIPLLLAGMFVFSAVALSFDGASGGGGGGSLGTTGGYAVEFADKKPVAYRFSVVDEDGNPVKKSIDVYRKQTGTVYITKSKMRASGDTTYTKMSKRRLIGIYSRTKFDFTTSQTNCYFDSDIGIALPEKTDGMKTWQSKDSNLDPVLSKMGIGNTTNLIYGDKIIIEPIFCVKIENVSCQLTVTEMSVYGGYMFGYDTAIKTSSKQGTWGFIATYTNEVYPNSLYTPDGQGLWAGASLLKSEAKFSTMIKAGYGVAIAYSEQSRCKVTYDPNGGTISGSTKDKVVFVNRNSTTKLLTPAKTSNNFLGWYTASSGGTKVGNAGASYKVTGNITLYAQWQPYFTVKYAANGGVGTMVPTVVIYGTPTPLRANAFTREGYTFNGWRVYRDYDGKWAGINAAGQSGWYKQSEIQTYTVYRDKYSVYAFAPSGTVTAYAQWKKIPKPGIDLDVTLVDFTDTAYSDSTVMVSAIITNESDVQFTSGNGVVVELQGKTPSGSFYTMSQTTIIPNQQQQLVWFEVTLPNYVGTVTFHATAKPEKTADYTFAVAEDENTLETVKYEKRTVPKSKQELEKPDTFQNLIRNDHDVAVYLWQYWTWDAGGFYRMVTNRTDATVTAVITPDAAANSWIDRTTGETVMRSGYGISSTVSYTLNSLPSGSVCGKGKVNMKLPEHNYADNITTSRYLELSVAEPLKRTFQLPVNTDSLNQTRTHFLPVWIPDGTYTAVYEVQDIWCPVGQLTATVTASVRIEGSLYNDWFTN